MMTVIYDPIDGMVLSDSRAIPQVKEWLAQKNLEVTVANAYVVLMIGEAAEDGAIGKNEIQFRFKKNGELSEPFGLEDQQDEFVHLMESMLLIK